MKARNADHIHCPECGCKLGHWIGRNWYLTVPFMPPPRFSVQIRGGVADYSINLPGRVVCEPCYNTRRAK